MAATATKSAAALMFRRFVDEVLRPKLASANCEWMELDVCQEGEVDWEIREFGDLDLAIDLRWPAFRLCWTPARQTVYVQVVDHYILGGVRVEIHGLHRHQREGVAILLRDELPGTEWVVSDDLYCRFGNLYVAMEERS